jgi:hypothetical protein
MGGKLTDTPVHPILHPLEPCRLRIVRAKQHVKTLKRQIRIFVNSHPYGFRAEYDSQIGRHRVRTVVRATPPPALSLLVSDICHQLRAALDGAVYLLALHGDGPGERNQFPIFSASGGFNSWEGRYLRGVRPAARDRIRQWQPFEEPDSWVTLMPLMEFNDFDKHRIVPTVVGASTSHSLRLPDGVEATDVVFCRGASMEEGTEFMRLRLNSAAADEIEVELEPRFTLLFGPVASIQLSADDLRIITNYVTNIIVSLKPFFPPPAGYRP